MNIALIGAPGSGKTSLALQLAAKLREKGTVAVIDGYVPEIEEELQLALGPFGDYIGNLHVALGRYARERLARKDNDYVISCGTFLETAVYMSMYFVGLMTTLTEEAKPLAAPRIDATLRMFAVLYEDVVEYDQAFYLPPVYATEDTEYIDKQLQAGVEAFKVIEVTALPDQDTRLGDALKALNG